MACNKFEEAGLLYISGELTPEEAKAYDAHVAACDECREELRLYSRERRERYQPSMFAENTPEGVDREILRLCAQRKTVPAGIGIFWMVTRKALAPVFFLALGLGGGVYIAYNIQTRNGNPAEYASPAPQPGTAGELRNTTADNSAPVQTALADSMNSRNDTKDSIDTPKAAVRRGNGTMEGIVPVDLKR